MKKIFLILLFFFNFSVTYSIDLESLSEATEEVQKIQEDFKNLSKSDNKIANTIDSAVEEINKATEFVQKSLKENNVDSAIKTLKFIEKSLGDVANVVPQELTSDMTKVDMSGLDNDKLDVVMSITKGMKENKEKKLNELVSNMVELQGKGLEVEKITSNLKKLGVDTVEIGINLEKVDEMNNWSKEQWSESYKGSIITSAGSEIITDDEINDKVIDLEQQLQTNNAAILDKRASLTELQTKIDPLSDQITDLQTQKTDLLSKYNEEILKQSSTVLSDQEITQSKELADQLNDQLTDLTNQIEVAEKLSNSLQQQVQGLNLELTNEIASKTQLENNIRDLSNQLSANQNVLSQKTSELNQLKNTNINSKINSLNEQIQNASRERDFIETEFERSIDLEVDAMSRYYSALGDVDSEDFDKQIDFSLREVGVIMDADPRKARAFELEKYATYAGFSNDQIQAGINAVNNDDWDTQKNFYKEITKSLAKNPDWVVDVPSNAELNVIIEEEKAIQAAALASMEVEEIRSAWNAKINEEVKEYQPLASLNTTWIKYAALQPNTAEAKMLDEEINKILSTDTELSNLKATLQEKQKQLSDIQEFQRLKTEELNNQIKPLREQVSNNYAKVNDLNRELISKMNEKTTYINSIGGYAALQRDKGNINYGEWVKNVNNFDEQINNINSEASKQIMEANKISSKIYKIQIDNATPNTEIDNWINLQREVGNLASQKVMKEGQVLSQARTALVSQVEEAQEKINEIYSQENPDLKIVEQKVTSILKDVPTFENDAERLAGLDPTTLRARLIDITNGNNNETEALNAARKAMSEVGKDPVGNLTGVYWEMTNVKAAAIVRSKKYDYVDDYAYMNAYYEDPLSLNSVQREEIEGELKNVLSKNNVKLQALNTKITELSSELDLTKNQSQNISKEIVKLENELSSLKNSESELQTKINDLTDQFNSKENLVLEKNQTLASLKDQLNPISERMNTLQDQRAALDGKLNEQLNTLANQVKEQGQVSDEANALKLKFESQIAELDNQLKDFENQSVEVNTQIKSLTAEIEDLEIKTPQIANQITKLNVDLQNAIDIKADLAISEAKKANIEIEEKIIGSIAKLDNKSIIKIEGTNSLRVIDTDLLTDEAGKFKMPEGTMTVNGNIFTAGAVQPEKLLSFEAIDETGDLKVSYSKAAIEQISNTGKLVGGTQKYTGSTLGSWVLVDAVTGKQMKNPLNGHQGSIVCESSTCGPEGSFGKQAASFGGMYVMENLADPETGNVAGMCSGGDCEFNFSQNSVLGIATNISQATTNSATNITQSVKLSEAANTDIEAVRKITASNADVTKNMISNTSELSSNVVDKLSEIASLGGDSGRLQQTIQEINKSQAAAAQMIASNVGNSITHSLSSQTAADALAGQMARDMVQGASNEVNSTSQQLKEARDALSDATTEVAQAAAQASVDAAEAANTAAREALQAAQEATQDIQQAAREAQQAAGDAVAGISGNDLDALSKLANDALGIWQEVDAEGRPVNDQQIVCQASMCGSQGAFGKDAASRGNSYVRTNRTDGY